MVRNREELLQCANAWVRQAHDDVRNQIVNFIQMSGTSEEELAYALGITRDELISIIETNNEISLSTFAKLLISTDNVLEIKPLAQSGLARAPRGMQQPHHQQNRPQPQRDAHGRFATARPNGGQPMRGQMPPMGGIAIDPRTGQPVDPRTGRPLPPPPSGFPMPPMGGNGQMPPRFGGMPGMGRRMPSAPQTVGGEQPLNELSSLSRGELVQMIRDNFWDGEIDAAVASKTELINFLTAKRGHMDSNSRVPQPMGGNVVRPQAEGYTMPRADVTEEVPTNVPMEEVAETPIEDASMTAFRQMLDNALAENPNLREVIGQYTN